MVIPMTIKATAIMRIITRTIWLGVNDPICHRHSNTGIRTPYAIHEGDSSRSPCPWTPPNDRAHPRAAERKLLGNLCAPMALGGCSAMLGTRRQDLRESVCRLAASVSPSIGRRLGAPTATGSSYDPRDPLRCCRRPFRRPSARTAQPSTKAQTTADPYA